MGELKSNNNTKTITKQDGAQKEDSSIEIKNSNDDSAKPAKEEAQSPMGAYFKLWSFASPLDVLIRSLAALASAGAGTAEPLMSIIFGDLVNLFNGNPPITPEEFRRRINKNALYFVYLFIGKFAVGRSIFIRPVLEYEIGI